VDICSDPEGVFLQEVRLYSDFNQSPNSDNSDDHVVNFIDTCKHNILFSSDSFLCVRGALIA